MNWRALLASVTMISLSVMLFSACTAKSYTNSKVDQCLKAAQDANSKDDPQEVELQLLKAVDIATDEGKGVPLMKALNALSIFYREQGKSERCSDLLMQAKGLGDQLLECDSVVGNVSEFQTEFLTTMVALANWERDMGHFSTAKRYYAVAMPLNEKLGTQSPVRKTLAQDFEKCVSEQDTQEGVEILLDSGKSLPKSKEGKENTRRKFSLQYKSIMDGYSTRDTHESEEMFVALINEVRSTWGLDEPFYFEALSGLLDVVQRTGNFYRIERILDQDIESMSGLDAKTNTGVRLGPAEVVEVGNLIDTLLWQSRVASVKFDLITAKSKAERALKITAQYYPESGLKLEECWRSLEQVHTKEGDFKSAVEFASRAIQNRSRRDPRSSVLWQLFFELGLSQLNQGQYTQVVSTAEALINRPAQGQLQRNVFRLIALRLVFEAELAIGDYEAAGKTNKLFGDLLSQSPRLRSTEGLAQIYQRYLLLFNRSDFAEYVRLNQNNNFDPKHFYYQWLYDSDLMSYAALRANQTNLALRFCKNVESAKSDRFSDSLFYSRVVRVWLNAMKSSDKSVTPVELDKSVKSLVVCVDNVVYPNRLFAVRPLAALAKYLTDSLRFESAEAVYSCALRVYNKVPSRVDEPLIEVLAGYERLLEEQNRRDEAWQIKARLEQKKQKFAALVSITKDSLKRANFR